MRGVPNYPNMCLKRLESYFSHAEMGSLTQQFVVAPITFGPPQVKGTGESDGPPCKGYTDTSNSSSLCFPHHHFCWVSYPPYPSCFIVSSSFQDVGWPSDLSTTHCVRPTFG
jgi:hypothetical protein